MTKPTEPAQHTAGTPPVGAEDPVLGRAVDTALHEARTRAGVAEGGVEGGGVAQMVLGEVQADLAAAEPAVAGTGTGNIDDLDASLAAAAAEATAKLLEEDAARLPDIQPVAALEPAPATAPEPPAPAPAAPAPAAEPEAAPAAEQAERLEAVIAAAAPAPAALAAARLSVREMLAAVLDPLAERVQRLPIGVRHTIAWAAALTLLNAAGVWTVVVWSSVRGPGPETAPAAAHTEPASHTPAATPRPRAEHGGR